LTRFHKLLSLFLWETPERVFSWRPERTGEEKMAIYRQLHCEFWSDRDILTYPLEKKAFYIYLLTNNRSKQMGIYEFSLPYAQLELGKSQETIIKWLKELQNEKKIIFSPDTQEIAILNWRKYNDSKSPKVRSCIEKEIKQVKDKKLVKILYGNEFDEVLNGIDTVSIEYEYSIDTVEIPDRKERKKNKEEKEKEEEKEFEILWTEYPRKEGKVKALQFYKKYNKEYSKEQFLTAIENYKKKIEKEKTDIQFIKMGSSFFNGCFIDYLPQCSAPPSIPGNGKKQEWEIQMEEDLNILGKEAFNL
jgi:ribosomal protein L12E/L44/L45/RPP1/RPP2